jgi:hypothetical protein
VTSTLADPHLRTSATGRERVVALDGLRAFALLIILGYHFGVARFQGGFFSLDIFYVRSGYLITGLLLGEWSRAARINLGAFWARRARTGRTLPAHRPGDGHLLPRRRQLRPAVSSTMATLHQSGHAGGLDVAWATPHRRQSAPTRRTA